MDDIENPLVPTIDTVEKQGNQNKIWCRKPTLLIFHQKRRLTHSTKKINHKYTSNGPNFQKNKPDTLNLMDKSRSTPRTNKSTRIENPTEIDILNDNENVSILFVQGDDLASTTPANIRIPRKNKRKKTPKTLVIINKNYSRTSKP